MKIKLPIKRRSKVNVGSCTNKWQDLQKLCSSRKTWPQAIFAADDLLNEVLKKRHYKGKTTGERLVAAQRILTSNESVWVGHKLRKTMEETNIDVRKLKKKDMVLALAGFRQALRDLGALDSD